MINAKNTISTEQAAVAIVASEAMKQVVNELPHIVCNAVAAARVDTEPPPARTKPWVRPVRRDQIDPRTIVPGAIQQSAFWRKKKGDRLGATWMVRPDSGNKLFIEQYGNECSVLRKLGKAIKKDGDQLMVYDAFKVLDGTLGEVISGYKEMGWHVQDPPLKSQAKLFEGGV